MQVLFPYGPRKLKPRVKRNYANSNKLLHFLTAIIWHTYTCNSSLANTKNYMLLYRVCFVLLFRIWVIFFKYKPPGAYIQRSDLTEGFLRYEFGGGVIFWVSYTWGLIFGLLRKLTDTINRNSDIWTWLTLIYYLPVCVAAKAHWWINSTTPCIHWAILVVSRRQVWPLIRQGRGTGK